MRPMTMEEARRGSEIFLGLTAKQIFNPKCSGSRPKETAPYSGLDELEDDVCLSPKGREEVENDLLIKNRNDSSVSRASSMFE